LENQFLRGNYRTVIDNVPLLLEEEQQYGTEKNKYDLHYLLGRAYFATGEISNALNHCKRALEGNKDLDSQYRIHKLLSEILLENHDLESVIKHKDMMTLIKDSINDKNKGVLFENSAIKFELLNYKHGLSLHQAQIEKQRTTFIEMLLLFLLLIIFLVVYFRNRQIKLKQKNELALQNKKIVELELEQEKNEKMLLEKQINEEKMRSEMENEHLKYEIELRNRQLASKALYISSKDQILDQIIKKLKNLPDLTKDKILQGQIELLKNNMNTKREWNLFFNHFEEINPSLLSNLKSEYPELNSNDLRLISYIYMKLSAKEIASILNITANAFRKRKGRISDKIGLDDDQSLFDFLFDFQKANSI